MSRFFIRRPVFAWVIALLIALFGCLSIPLLPIAQYPDIAPPVVNVYTSYAGASAQVTEEAVTAIIEKELNGAPGLLYMTASSTSSGTSSIAVTFKQGTDPDIAAVEVQNRLRAVEAQLPDTVRQEGVTVEKSGENLQAMVSLSSPTLSGTELGEIAAARVIPELKRVKGVGRVQSFGTEAAMRIWPDPDRLQALRLTPSDIVSAVSAQSSRITVGELGGAAVTADAPINVSVVAEEPFHTPEQFASIALKTKSDGSSIKLGDVARIELGASTYSYFSRHNGQTATGMGIKMAPGANAVETMRLIREKMEELSRDFPSGVSWELPYETSHFVQISIRKVVQTLVEAVALVFIVMFLFLQSFRATLIPTLVVPIALLGTFAVMKVSGFSINMLTMFGMVLSIGILVDDAIVVVENVERIMTEEGLSAREATQKAMRQISGAIVGITAVLVAVFIPMAFFSGAVGNIYRQFSLTLIVSIAFSAFLALTFTPALCAAMLKRREGKRGGLLGPFFNAFNRGVSSSTRAYGKAVGGVIRRPLRSLLVYGLTLAASAWLYGQLPTSFLPEEDQGNFTINVTLPVGSLQEETSRRLADIEHYLMESEPVSQVMTIGGFSAFGEGSNAAMLFVEMKDWAERTDASQTVQAVVERVNARFADDPQMTVMAFNSPALPDLGDASGFDFRLLNRGGLDMEQFLEARHALLDRAREHPDLADVFFSGQADTPKLVVSIDRDKAFSMGVPISEISNALSVMFGSNYTGDFMHGDQVRRIIIQADGRSRQSLADIEGLHVRNESNELLPLSSFISLKWEAGPAQLTRYNTYPSFPIQGSAAAGKSSGDAMAAMEEIAATLPQGVGFAWSGQSYEEKQAGSQAALLFALSVLIVFLVLAALYESWTIPLAVILVIPLGLVGALTAVYLQDMANDIYFKVGLITTIGLSAKNAILIVEVARDLHFRDGLGVLQAAVAAAKLRLRPILMTSIAFGAGVLPLAVAHGAAAGAQRAVGTGVLGGIVTATALAIFLVPLFFRLVVRRKKTATSPSEEA